jgi:hypothetical protein
VCNSKLGERREKSPRFRCTNEKRYREASKKSNQQPTYFPVYTAAPSHRFLHPPPPFSSSRSFALSLSSAHSNVTLFCTEVHTCTMGIEMLDEMEWSESEHSSGERAHGKSTTISGPLGVLLSVVRFVMSVLIAALVVIQWRVCMMASFFGCCVLFYPVVLLAPRRSFRNTNSQFSFPSFCVCAVACVCLSLSLR